MALAAKKFSYYRNLSARQRRIYDQSDSVPHILIPYAQRFQPAVKILESALVSGQAAPTQAAAQKLLNDLCYTLKVPGVYVKVLERRPSRYGGEMHGLYTAERGRHSVITVWMKTAKRRDVVAFRTFLRTMIHELIHHLDYTWLKLHDSFHTTGFFKRESSVVKTLLGEADLPANPGPGLPAENP